MQAAVNVGYRLRCSRSSRSARFLALESILRGMLPSPLDSKETGTKPEVIRAVPHGTRGWTSRKQLVVKSSGTAVCDIAPTRSFTAHGPASSANF